MPTNAWFRALLIALTLAGAGCRCPGPEGAGEDAGLLSDAGADCAHPEAPTFAVLEAAHDALERGALDVALSADGCWRLRRVMEVDRVARDEVLLGVRSAGSWDYAATATTLRRDEDLDGVADWTATISPAAPPDDEVMVATSDPGATGSPVRRVTYTRRGDAIHVQVEERDGGVLATTSEFDTTRYAASDIIGPTAGTGPGSCTQDQADRVRAAMQQAIDEGLACFARFVREDDIGLLGGLVARGIELRCGPTSKADYCAEIDWWKAQDHPKDRLLIIVNGNLFFSPQDCPSSARQLWHELLHLLHGPHTLDRDAEPNWRRVDKIEACSRMCFSDSAGYVGTKCQCAACLGKSDCHPLCKPLADCRALCTCSASSEYGKVYANAADCPVNCTASGLGCFGSGRCADEDNGGCP